MSRLEERLRIALDGGVVAFSGKVEFGQDLATAFARLVAEELVLAPDRVQVVLGDTASVPWDMGTFGSMSVKNDGALLARAAAFARQQLLARAAERLGLPVGALRAEDGAIHGPDGRTLGYGELVADAPLVGDIPEDVALISPERRRMLEASAERRGARDIVTGAAHFVADLRLPGLLRGRVLHPPLFRARLRALDDRAARALPGVVAVVREGDFVGVVAERADQAQAALDALEAAWEAPPPADSPERRLVLRRDPGVAPALAAASFEAEYEAPHVANAPIGTSAALADVRPEGATLHAATQRPFGLRDEAAALLGLPPERVHVVAERGAGSYGRNNASDAALEAARLSRATGRPVLVEWSRLDEFRTGPCRPALHARIRAALGAGGAITAWSSEILTNPHVYGGSANLPDAVIAMTAGRNAVPPYRLPAAEVLLRVVPAPIRTGALRSLAAAPSVFAIESAMDELARAAGACPLAFRLRHVDDPRLARVLETVAAKSRFAERRENAGPGRGLGLACAIYHGTYLAEVAEVEVAESGEVRFLAATAAVDCGRLVDARGARSQIEGGIVQGASWSLLEELRQRDGRIAAAGWDDYSIATFRDAPRSIEITFTGEEAIAPTGLGESGVVPIGAALANAVAAACGARVRQLPLRPERVRLTAGARARPGSAPVPVAPR